MLTLVVILLQITLGVLLIRFFIKHDRGAKEPRSGIKAAIGFGLLAIVIATVLNGIVDGFHLIDLDIMDGPVTIMSAASVALLTGLIEESSKSIPLAIFIWRKPYFNEISDGIFYFGISATVFSVLEDILYTLDKGVGVGLTRLLFMPLHLGFAMWFGFFLAKRKVTGHGTIYAVLGLIVSMLLHALYDFGLFVGIPLMGLMSFVIGMALITWVFKLYRLAQSEDAQMSLAADGENAFCRHCGKPNPNHTLYCEKCGQKT